MKNLFDYKILDDINEKINNLENSFVDIDWASYQPKSLKNDYFIGLFSNKMLLWKFLGYHTLMSVKKSLNLLVCLQIEEFF